MNWAGLKWTETNWTKINWFKLNWTDVKPLLKCEMNWTELKAKRTELTLNGEREWGEHEMCCKHKYPSYPVWSHHPANYTAYYPWALYRGPKSHWIMGAQPLPVTEQHCQVVWQPERTSSYSFHPLSLSVPLSSSLFLTLCASGSLPVNLTSLKLSPPFLISIFYFSDFSFFLI